MWFSFCLFRFLRAFLRHFALPDASVANLDPIVRRVAPDSIYIRKRRRGGGGGGGDGRGSASGILKRRRPRRRPMELHCVKIKIAARIE